MEAYYIATHTNHEPGIDECKHLPLPPSVKSDIQQQFAAGKSLEKIMDGKFIWSMEIDIIYSTSLFYYQISKVYSWKKDRRDSFLQEATRSTSSQSRIAGIDMSLILL